MAEEDFALDVVLEDVACGSGLIWLTETLCGETSGNGVGAEDFVRGQNAGSTFFDWSGMDLHSVEGLEERLWDAACNKTGGTSVLAELVDRQYTSTYEFGFGCCKVGEH